MGRRNKNNQNNYPYQNGQYYNGQYSNQNGYYNGQYYNQNGQYYNQNGYYNNQYPQYNQNYGYNYQNNNKKKKTPFNLSKTALIGIAAFIVFVIVIIVTIIIINTSDSDGKDNNDVKENPPVEEKTTKTVGNNTLGYVEIPEEWVKFQDVNAVRGLQYSSEDAKYIITLDAMATSEVGAETYAKAVAAQLSKEGVKDLQGARIQISNYNAYQVSGYYEKDKIWLYVWCFEAEDGNTHYIGIEGPDDNSEYFKIFKTFTLKK